MQSRSEQPSSGANDWGFGGRRQQDEQQQITLPTKSTTPKQSNTLSNNSHAFAKPLPRQPTTSYNNSSGNIHTNKFTMSISNNNSTKKRRSQSDASLMHHQQKYSHSSNAAARSANAAISAEVAEWNRQADIRKKQRLEHWNSRQHIQTTKSFSFVRGGGKSYNNNNTTMPVVQASMNRGQVKIKSEKKRIGVPQRSCLKKSNVGLVNNHQSYHSAARSQTDSLVKKEQSTSFQDRMNGTTAKIHPSVNGMGISLSEKNPCMLTMTLSTGSGRYSSTNIASVQAMRRGDNNGMAANGGHSSSSISEPASLKVASAKQSTAPHVGPSGEVRLQSKPIQSKPCLGKVVKKEHKLIVQKSGEECIDLTIDKTHVIFTIDFSGSMKTRDVKTSNGKVTRWDAVFECVDTFLTQQLQQQQNGQSGEMSACLISVVIFNDESEVLLKRIPLIGNGQKVRNSLENARKNHVPKGGTGFAAGFKKAEMLARCGVDDKVLLVFLSDGRPGDLQSKPPSLPTEAMQATFKRNKKTFPAAGSYLESMQNRHVDFNLQLICLYDEGIPCKYTS